MFLDLTLPEKGILEKNELNFLKKSLLSLVKCIKAMNKKNNSFIPFRDSILTKVMKNYLKNFQNTYCLGFIDEN